MKVAFHEYDSAFSIEMTPETISEVAWLARWNMNVKEKPPMRMVSANKDGTFYAWCSWGKRKDVTSYIRRK